MSQRGFTLIEPIGTLAVPSINGVLRDARASSLAEMLQGASRFARSASGLSEWRALPAARGYQHDE